MTHPKAILVVGTGSWGHALAHLCWKKCHDHVAILGRKSKEETLAKLQNHNPDWPSNIRIHDNWAEALSPNPGIIIATPSAQTALVLDKLAEINYDGPVLCASKGMAHVSPPTFFHQYYQLKNPQYQDRFAYLAGPNFADEVWQGQPTISQIACPNQAVFAYWDHILATPLFRLRYHEDMIGTGWCGVFKNITAFLAGTLAGCGYGANTRALLIQQACEELQSLITSSGGNPHTAFSVAGLGDMVLSGTSTQSRNFLAGENPQRDIKRLAESLTNIPLASAWLARHPQSHASIIYLTQQLLDAPGDSKALLATWLETVG